MINYCINIVTLTKNQELFDKVSVNKFPFVCCVNDKAELETLLSSDTISNYIVEQCKTKFLFDNAELYIRAVTMEGEHYEWTVSVPDKYTWPEQEVVEVPKKKRKTRIINEQPNE